MSLKRHLWVLRFAMRHVACATGHITKVENDQLGMIAADGLFTQLGEQRMRRKGGEENTMIGIYLALVN